MEETLRYARRTLVPEEALLCAPDARPPARAIDKPMNEGE
jgi:hypothetical protein